MHAEVKVHFLPSALPFLLLCFTSNSPMVTKSENEPSSYGYIFRYSSQRKESAASVLVFFFLGKPYNKDCRWHRPMWPKKKRQSPGMWYILEEFTWTWMVRFLRCVHLQWHFTTGNWRLQGGVGGELRERLWGMSLTSNMWQCRAVNLWPVYSVPLREFNTTFEMLFKISLAQMIFFYNFLERKVVMV